MSKDFFLKGSNSYKNKEYREAIHFYSKHIELYPEDVNGYYERAMSFYHLGELNKAVLDLDRAQTLEPNNAFRYSSRAYVKSNLKDVDGAIADYKKAVHLDPEDAVAYNNLGLLLEQKGYKKRAEESFKKADQLKGEEPSNMEAIISPEKLEVVSEQNEASTLNDVLKGLATKRGWNEFIQFVLNGFKLKQ